jgi:soluble lytic murein transglycosylase-like protein
MVRTAISIGIASALLALAVPASGQVVAYRNHRGNLVYTNLEATNEGRPTRRGERWAIRRSGSAPVSRFTPLIRRVAARDQLDPRLVEAVIRVESSGNPRAVSSKGAAGLMQLIPATARRFGVANSFDPGENVRGGAAYLHELLHRYAGNLRNALAAYYAGAGAVARAGNAPPADAAGYVRRVLSAYFETKSPEAGAGTEVSSPIYAARNRLGQVVYTNQ